MFNLKQWDEEIAKQQDIRTLLKRFTDMSSDHEKCTLLMFEAPPVMKDMLTNPCLREVCEIFPAPYLIDCCGDVDLAYIYINDVIDNLEGDSSKDDPVYSPENQQLIDQVYDFTTNVKDWINSEVSKVIEDPNDRVVSCIPIKGGKVGVILHE